MIEEIIDLRRRAREAKDYYLSDVLRDYLDSKKVFVFDTKYGQEELCTGNAKDRKEAERMVQSDIRAEKNFDAWLVSIRKQIKDENNKNGEG